MLVPCTWLHTTPAAQVQAPSRDGYYPFTEQEDGAETRLPAAGSGVYHFFRRILFTGGQHCVRVWGRVGYFQAKQQQQLHKSLSKDINIRDSER